MKKVLFGILCSSVLLANSAVRGLAAEKTPREILDSTEVPSYILMEAKTGAVLEEKNADEKRNVSHLVKLMTILLTAEAIDGERISEETETTASKYANSMQGTQIWLNVGEKITIRELLLAVTVGNANDAAVVLAEKIGGTEENFVKMMNERAQEFSMTSTVFADATGLSEANCSTAKDMAKLAAELTKYDFLTDYYLTWMTDVRGGQTNLVNTNLLVRSYQGLTGMKAAASELAGNCVVASAEKSGMKMVAVVLGSSDKDERFTVAKALLNYGFTGFESYLPEIGKELLTDVAVSGGEVLSVKSVPENNDEIILRKGAASGVKVMVELEPSVEAPVSKGQVIGKAVFTSDGQEIHQINIVAGESVREMTIIIAIKKVLYNMFNF